MSGKTAEKMIRKTVFGAKIEHHIVHSYGREPIETVKITDDLFQNLQTDPFIVERHCGKVMNHPCTFVRPDHRNMSVDSAVSLVGHLGDDFRIIMIKFPIGF